MKMKAKHWEWIKALQDGSTIICLLNDKNILFISEYDEDRTTFIGVDIEGRYSELDDSTLDFGIIREQGEED